MDLMLKRLKSILNKSSKQQSISDYEGYGFKKEVGKQLKKYLRKLSPEIEMPARAKGIYGSNYYDVDMHITVRGKELFAHRGDIWVECKWKDDSLVDESDIQKLVYRAQDTFRHATELGGFCYDTLIMVSNQDFDINALHYANALDVMCLRYFQGKLIEKNAPMNWLGTPAWIKQENNYLAFKS